MQWGFAVSKVKRPHQQQIFMLGSLALHLVPIILIGMQWQEFRLSAASLPTPQIMQVELRSLSEAVAAPQALLTETKEAQQAEPSLAQEAGSSPLSIPSKETSLSNASDAEEAEFPEVLPSLPPPYLTSRELDERPWPATPVLLPFPDISWEGGQVEGILELFIDIDGTVDRIEIKESTLPPEFEQAALDAFKHVKIKPGIKEGRPVRSIMKILVEFEERREKNILD